MPDSNRSCPRLRQDKGSPDLVSLDSAGSMCALLFVLYLARVRDLMSRAKLRNVWTYLAAWGALLLGSGALVGSAQADVGPGSPGQSDLGTHVVLKIDGDKILISQDGRNFEELRLGDTREALHLRSLLRDEVSDGRSITVPVGSMIVASGGASGRGWGWKSGQQPTSRLPANKGSGK